MTGIKGHDYTWSNSWIEFKAPNAQGVYCLRDKEGNVLFIGKGKLRERLSHPLHRKHHTASRHAGAPHLRFRRGLGCLESFAVSDRSTPTVLSK